MYSPRIACIFPTECTHKAQQCWDALSASKSIKSGRSPFWTSEMSTAPAKSKRTNRRRHAGDSAKRVDKSVVGFSKFLKTQEDILAPGLINVSIKCSSLRNLESFACPLMASNLLAMASNPIAMACNARSSQLTQCTWP